MNRADLGFFQPRHGGIEPFPLFGSLRRTCPRLFQRFTEPEFQLARGFLGERDRDHPGNLRTAALDHAHDAAHELRGFARTRRSLDDHHDVTAFDDPRAALRNIESGSRYDLILCDLMMPDISGMDFHTHVARLAPEQADKIIFLTGGAFTGAARTFIQEIRNARVEKPFDPVSLRALVNSRIR